MRGVLFQDASLLSLVRHETDGTKGRAVCGNGAVIAVSYWLGIDQDRAVLVGWDN